MNPESWPDRPRRLPVPRTVSSVNDTLIQAWRSWLTASDLAPQSIRLRYYQLARFARSHPDLATVTSQQLTDWLARPGWSTDTRRSQRAALRSFYGWLQATGQRPDDPSRLLRRIRAAKHQARPAPDSAVQEAIDRSDARSRLMVTLAVRLGIRRGEIALVHSDDLIQDLVGWSLLVHGKGRKERIVPLSPDVAAMLLALPKGWAFPGLTDGHLSAGHVGVLVGRALPDGWTTHTLRHTFATKAYARTGDLAGVQEILGHESPTTTRNYVRVPPEALRAVVNAAA